MPQKDFTAAQVAKIAGCHRNTVVNYTLRGVITSMRDSNGFRRYTMADALKLKKIIEHRIPDTPEKTTDVR